MQHEDGFCDECGCRLDVFQLTLDGRTVCAECAGKFAAPPRQAKRPEARDDGR